MILQKLKNESLINMKFFVYFLLLLAFFLSSSIKLEANEDFNSWLINFSKIAIKKGISKKTLNNTLLNAEFLKKVIEYDRKQPEFIEDTLTYVNKRATKNRSKIAKKLLKENLVLFDEIEKKFNVDKELLLALWGIETNFGKHVGKMDIISSLATLSFDKRRRDFFSSELLILLQLIDKKIIDSKTLYGSWAGAYGNFQFMPSTIKGYAIDYDKNGKIELKSSLKDSLASAANYINKIGWRQKTPCFFRVKSTKDINQKLINLSAKKISNKLSIKVWKKKGIINYDGSELNGNHMGALILPDAKPNSPMYLVFNNYEKVLKWNRSLRFGVSVCTLANMI